LKKKPPTKRSGHSSRKNRKEKKKQRVDDLSTDAEEDWPCLICCEPYSRTRPNDVWVQCQVCHHWAHEACTEGLPTFICQNCD
jgi:hypothetical protein